MIKLFFILSLLFNVFLVHANEYVPRKYYCTNNIVSLWCINDMFYSSQLMSCYMSDKYFSDENKVSISVTNSMMTISFDREVEGRVYIDIFNISGVLLDRHVLSDSNIFSFDLYTEGLLVVKIKTDNSTYIKKIVNTIY